MATILQLTLDLLHIQWKKLIIFNGLLLKQKKGNQRKELKFTDKPVAHFCVGEDDEIVAAYAYCNIHSLWKA